MQKNFFPPVDFSEVPHSLGQSGEAQTKTVNAAETTGTTTVKTLKNGLKNGAKNGKVNGDKK